jgi:hypothetical protein
MECWALGIRAVSVPLLLLLPGMKKKEGIVVVEVEVGHRKAARREGILPEVAKNRYHFAAVD